MIRPISSYLLAAFLAISCTTAQADIIDTNIIDNSSYTTDTVSGLEWLDLTTSSDQSMDYVTGQFGVGGEYEGWRHATVEEVIGFINNAGGDSLNTYDSPQYPSVINDSVLDDLVQLLGSNYVLTLMSEQGLTFEEAVAYVDQAGLDSTGGFLDNGGYVLLVDSRVSETADYIEIGNAIEIGESGPVGSDYSDPALGHYLVRTILRIINTNHDTFIDEASGLEWMDFGINNHQTMNEVIAELDTTYAGWSLATEAQVLELMHNAFSGKGATTDEEYAIGDIYAEYYFLRDKRADPLFLDTFFAMGFNTSSSTVTSSFGLFFNSIGGLALVYVRDHGVITSPSEDKVKISSRESTSIYYATVTASGYSTLLVRNAVAEFKQAPIVDTENDSFIDTATGLEWMDFDRNNHESMQQVLDSLETTWYGWALATEIQVREMLENAYGGLAFILEPSETSNTYVEYYDERDKTIEPYLDVMGYNSEYDIGSTHGYGGIEKSSIGLFFNGDGNIVQVSSTVYSDKTTTDIIAVNGRNIDLSYLLTQSSQKTFTFLVRSSADPVPVPRIVPVANAGVDLVNLATHFLITLDGVASNDADENYPLSYQWMMVSDPVGNLATLQNTNTVTPSFTPVVPGLYVFQLVVTDATGLVSATDSVNVSVRNRAPLFSLSSVESMHIGGFANITASYQDQDGHYPLTFEWDLVGVPEASTTSLILFPNNDGLVRLMPDLLGDYEVQLILTDSTGLYALPQSVVINVSNDAPVTNAGADISISVLNQIVELDGSSSSDVNGDELSYQWTWVSKPTNSTAILDDATAQRPTFSADKNGDYTLNLVVSDPWIVGNADEVNISFINVAPIANAGGNISVVLGETVQLNGSATDANGDAITLTWTLVLAPVASTATLNNADTAMPSITGDVVGDYLIELVATDAEGLVSAPAQVIVSVLNIAPTANAGEALSAHVGDLVTMNGAASIDVDLHYPLTYQWTLMSSPDGLIIIDDANTVTPSFIASSMGDYSVELIVTDALGLSSAPSIVHISTYNTAPVTNAGDDLSISFIGEAVNLDGTRSNDAEDDAITYQWFWIEKPEGSTAELTDATIAQPGFTVDVHGDYKLGLTVSDYWVAGSTDEVLITFDNVAPIANAGNNQSAVVTEAVYVEGVGSDANGDNVTYSWSFVSTPVNSTVEFLDSTSYATSFVPDEPGEYVLSLVVNDGFADSAPSNINIVAITIQDVLTAQLRHAIDQINSYPNSAFKFWYASSRSKLTSRLNTALDRIEVGDYSKAKSGLQSDVLKYVDSCSGGSRWGDLLRTCEYQLETYGLVSNAILILSVLDDTYEPQPGDGFIDLINILLPWNW